MLHFLYKTTNILNKKSYIGVHSTEDIEDGYLGSGLALLNAIKKHGKENFKREILEFFNSKEDAFLREKEIVNEDWVNTPNTYNAMLGGKGGNFTAEIKNKIAKTLTGRKQSAETVEKRRQKHIGRKNTKETLEKMSSIAKNRRYAEDARKSFSQAAKNRAKVECPHCNKTGDVSIMKRWHFDHCKSRL